MVFYKKLWKDEEKYKLNQLMLVSRAIGFEMCKKPANHTKGAGNMQIIPDCLCGTAKRLIIFAVKNIKMISKVIKKASRKTHTNDYRLITL